MSRQLDVLSCLTGAYSLARTARLFQMDWFRRVFAFSYFAYKRFYEDSLAELVRRKPEIVGPGDILDVGANIGYTSVVLSQFLSDGARVYAFEPDGLNFQLLREVIRRRQLVERIVPINVAVGNSNGSVRFWHNKRHHGDHRVVTAHYNDFHPDPAQIAEVPLVSLDNFVETRNLGRISFIKVDVQGYELAVCEGMRQILASSEDTKICIEYAPKALGELGFQGADLLEFFRACGYVIHIVRDSTMQLAEDYDTVHRYTDREGYVDLLCSKNRLA
jgi:FkbM family methyltransferase